MLKAVPLTRKPKNFVPRADSKADVMMLCIDDVGCTLYRGKQGKIQRKIGRYKSIKIGLDKQLMHVVDEKNKHLDKVLGKGGQYQMVTSSTTYNLPYHPNPHAVKLSAVFAELGAVNAAKCDNGFRTTFEDGTSEGIT